jgi:hypothetical protein
MLRPRHVRRLLDAISGKAEIPMEDAETMKDRGWNCGRWLSLEVFIVLSYKTMF